MNLFGMLEVSGSALAAERWRAEVVSANMANAETTRTPQGGAYRRQLVVFRARPMARFPLLLAALHQARRRACGWTVSSLTRRRCPGATSRDIPMPTHRDM